MKVICYGNSALYYCNLVIYKSNSINLGLNSLSVCLYVIWCEINWRPPSQSTLTPMIFNMGLTHLGLEASNYGLKLKKDF